MHSPFSVVQGPTGGVTDYRGSLNVVPTSRTFEPFGKVHVFNRYVIPVTTDQVLQMQPWN